MLFCYKNLLSTIFGEEPYFFSYSENFGMSIIEAMACGVPVVLSNRVGIAKEVEQAEAGIIVRLDPDNIAAAIRELLNNDILRSKIVQNAHILVNNSFNIKNTAQKTLEMYQDLI